MTKDKSKARRFKTITKEGEERKFNRIVAQLLAISEPSLFKKLSKEAKKLIRKDNASAYTEIMEAGLDVVHKTSIELLIRKEIDKQKRDIDTRSKSDEKSNPTSNNNRRN